MPSVARNPLKQVAAGWKGLQERHAARHRPSGFNFALADNLGLLHPAKWDEVAGGRQFFMRRAVLAAMEAHRPANLLPRYALVCRDEKPVAAVAAQLVDISGRGVWKPAAPPSEQPLARLLRPATKGVMAHLEERMLVAGNLMSWGFHGIAFAPDEDPAAVWPGVAEALYRIRRADKLGGETDFVMVKDVTPAEAHADALRRFSYRPMETEPNMVLDLNPAWRTYEDYLGALDAKYRRNCRDQLKKLASAGCVMERLANLRPATKRLHDLYLAVQSRAAVKLVTLPDSFLPALAEAAGDDFRCTVIRRGEELLGFVTTLRDGDTAIGYYIGFDRAVAEAGVPLYLRLLHATVADAIGWGCRRLSLGRTALEPKATIGARPEPMCVWLRHRVPAMNWLLRGMLDSVPHAEAPERSPFKAASGR